MCIYSFLLFIYLFFPFYFRGSVLVDEAKLLWYNGQHYKLQCKDTNKLNGFIERLRAVLLARHDLKYLPVHDD